MGSDCRDGLVVIDLAEFAEVVDLSLFCSDAAFISLRCFEMEIGCMRLLGLLAGIALAAVTSMVATSPAHADETFTFRIKSEYEYKVQIAFFSQDRNFVWPGPGRAFSLDDSRTQSFPLRCESGEKICYGAWVTGDGSLSWGVGPKNDQSCKKCCFVCGDADMTPILTLSE